MPYYIAMDIQITEAAASRMREFLDNTPGAVGIRVGVSPSGCSGYSYKVTLAMDPGDKETAISVNGINVLVETESIDLIEGTVIDFKRQGVNASFVFENPNATGECGCGESFAVS